MHVLLGGRYRTVGLLGTGGMASVYRATDETLEREVAIKIFSPIIPNDEEAHRQHTETLLVARLHHPNLVALFDAGVHTDGTGAQSTYLVMELIDGADLRTVLSEGPLPAVEVAELGADLADALNYIHGQGVVHRDMKPANILLADSDGQDTRLHPKLTDFGIARNLAATSVTTNGATIGTASYLSPEQATGSEVGTASDIYSLGLVLLECVTGQKEFPGPIVESAVARLMRDPKVPADIDPPLRSLLQAMTHRDPQQRPTAHAAALTLREYSGTSPLEGIRRVAEGSGPEDIPTSGISTDAAPALGTNRAKSATGSNGSNGANGSDSNTTNGSSTTGNVTTGNVNVPTPPNRAPRVG